MSRAAATTFLALAAALSSCGGGKSTGGEQAATPLSAGQVASPSATPKVTHYAASRFAEQVSFGPTPALVAEIRAKGFEKWIDEQLALPFVPIDVKPAEEAYTFDRNTPLPDRLYRYAPQQMMRLSLVAPDQLRVRAMWSLAQFIVVSGVIADSPPAVVHWVNLLYRQAFGNYGVLLRELSTNPTMGEFLDNVRNRPKSAECPHCAPNENFARELMQLFSIGVFKLNADGTPQRDTRGRFIETYAQADVEELARALTGWMHEPLPGSNARSFGNWGKPMVPSTWPAERDSGRKVVMGLVLPAGQTAGKDLDDIVQKLMSHPNMAPFVATRLIQQLVKSDPTPAYVGRVASKFRDNGGGVSGDMKAVIKATLLDAEARRGDDLATAKPEDGKFREPWLHRMAMFRGLACQSNFFYGGNEYWGLRTQAPFEPGSVFGFYAPTDRAPGSNLLAPEQRLVGARELTLRMSEANNLRWNRTVQANDLQLFRDAGCDVDPWIDAYALSPKTFLDLLSERYFRGAMPPTLRANLEQMILQPSWDRFDTAQGAMRVIGVALAAPSFGVIK